MRHFFPKSAWDYVCLLQNFDEEKQQPVDFSRHERTKIKRDKEVQHRRERSVELDAGWRDSHQESERFV